MPAAHLIGTGHTSAGDTETAGDTEEDIAIRGDTADDNEGHTAEVTAGDTIREAELCHSCSLSTWREGRDRRK